VSPDLLIILNKDREMPPYCFGWELLFTLKLTWNETRKVGRGRL